MTGLRDVRIHIHVNYIFGNCYKGTKKCHITGLIFFSKVDF